MNAIVAPISYQEAGAELLIDEAGPQLEIMSPELSGYSTDPAHLTTVTAPRATLVRLRNVQCLPQGLLMKEGGLLPDTFRRGNPQHNHRHLDNQDNRLSLKKPVATWETCDEPCFYLDGEHASHFGHLTLEVIGRLWPLLSQPDFQRYRFVTSSKLAGHVLTVLRAFGVSDDRLMTITKPTIFSNLVVASQPFVLGTGVHPFAFEVWQHIGQFYNDITLPKKIFVSRLDTRKQRNLSNEPELANYFCLRGFTNIYPASLSPGRQIALFANATDIVGPSGSNIYGAVYALRQGRRLLFAPANFIKKDEAFIAHGTRSALHIVTGAPVQSDLPAMLADWSIEPQPVFDASAKLFSD